MESMSCARSRRYRWTKGCPKVRVAESDLLPDAPSPANDEVEEGGSLDGDEIAIVCATCFGSDRGVVECSECLRGFHAQGGDGCNPLRLDPEEAEAVLASDSFKCPNCTANRHQCHSCKKEGSCVEPNATLFMCLLLNCNLLHCSECQRGEVRRTICPRHLCAECDKVSSESAPLIECDQCSVSYHRDCLPDSMVLSTRVRYEEWKMICDKHCEADRKEGVRFSEDVLAQWRQEFRGLLSRKRVHLKRRSGPLEGSGEVLKPSDHPSIDEPAVPNSCHDRWRASRCPLNQTPTDGKTENRQIVWEATPRASAKRRASTEALQEINDDYLFRGGDGDEEMPEAEITEQLRAKRNVKKKLKVFSPHDSDPPRPVHWSRVKNLGSLGRARDNGRVDARIYAREVDRFVCIQQTIDRYLGPILHGDRYTSFGRHFTKDEVMDKVVDHVMRYTAHGDMIVDMTCGANTFVPAVKARAKKLGATVRGKAFDVIVPYNPEDWVQESWFNVRSADLGTDIDHLIIGINPPFGMNGNLAGKFVQHACNLEARLVFLIVPPKTKNPFGYKVIYEDDELCRKKGSRGHREKGAAFYLPSNKLESWSAVTPHFRILERVDPPVVTNLRYVGQPSESPSPISLDHMGSQPFHRNIGKMSELQACTPLGQHASKAPPPMFETPKRGVLPGKHGRADQCEDLVPMRTFVAPVARQQPLRMVSERPVNCGPMPPSLDPLQQSPSMRPPTNNPCNDMFGADGDRTRQHIPEGCGTMTLSSWGSKAVNPFHGRDSKRIKTVDLRTERVGSGGVISPVQRPPPNTGFAPPQQCLVQNKLVTGTPRCDMGRMGRVSSRVIRNHEGTQTMGLGGQPVHRVAVQNTGRKTREIRTMEVIEYDNGNDDQLPLQGEGRLL